MRILISGLGVAGPTLAYWLRRHGFTPTIVEKAPAPRRGGYVVDFWGAGYAVAEKMGLLPRLNAAGYFVDEVRLVGADGRKVGGFPAGVFQRATGGRLVSLPRGELSAAIWEAVEGQVQTLFANSIAAIEEAPGGVRVAFERGPARDFDLVVGCDGLHSVVRRLAFGPQERFERYLGFKVAAFDAAGYRPRDEDVYLSYGEPGRQIARFSMRGDRTMFLFVFADDDSGSPDDPRAALHRVFDGLAWREAPAAMAALDGAEAVYFDRASQIVMPGWTRGRVALVGDAAFCPSLLAGEGSALAMLGAYVLAGELKAAGGDHAGAFAAYEARLAGFIAAKQKQAARTAPWFAPRTAFQIFLRNMVSRAMVIPPIADLFMGASLRDDIALPEY